MVQILSTNTFTTAKWIVSATASDGTHTTVQAAITEASSGDTIFIRPGTYTENLTLKAGVDLATYDCDALTPNVTIAGTCTLTTAGTVSISGIRLQTNSAALLAVTGSAASIVNLSNCYLNCSNNTGITFSSSSASAAINIDKCKGNLGTTGIGYFTHTSAGSIFFNHSFMTNTGNSLTASTCSSGTITLTWTNFNAAITTSSTASFGSFYSVHDMGSLNTTVATIGGNSTNNAISSLFASGTASAISIGTGASLFASNITVNSTNTNAITGAGTLVKGSITFINTSSTINTTAQTLRVLDAGQYKGRIVSTAPSAGMIGETIISFTDRSSAQPLSNSAVTNISQISLTAGIWDISLLGCIQGVVANAGALNGSTFSIATTISNQGTVGTSAASTIDFGSGAFDPSVSIPAFRVSLATTTIYYFNIFTTYTSTGPAGYGRISAVRVA